MSLNYQTKVIIFFELCVFRLFPCNSTDFSRVYYEAHGRRSWKIGSIIIAQVVIINAINGSNNAIKLQSPSRI